MYGVAIEGMDGRVGMATIVVKADVQLVTTYHKPSVSDFLFCRA